MARVKLGGTDLEVSPICLGTWQFNMGKTTINWDGQSLETSKAIVDKCFEQGINFFDTAEGYAGSEEALGACLEGRRRDAVIATKYGFRAGPNTPPYSAEDIQNTMDKALKNLRTDYIDIIQIHFPAFIKDYDETVTELNRQISLGRLKHYAVSNFGPKNMKQFIEAGGKPISNQMGYNLLWRSAEYGVLPVCKENNVSVLAYSPLQQGLLTGKYSTVDDVPEGRRRGKLFSRDSTQLSRHGQDGAEKEVFEAIQRIRGICDKAGVPMAKAALSWLLQQDNVPVAIVGASTPQQVVENSNIVKLSDDVVKQLSDATEELKAKVGQTLDAWVHPDRCE
ncbi:aldo-keto reductase IolS-like [Haliotis rubra]|uniref:aldo-keto reductase IolS-like n=1 Tax=Haliotis rubra TaxID=36100 RepID=UPI001EE62517|nr:aldo-keto reductase IolS-like [Haliotis rubra]